MLIALALSALAAEPVEMDLDAALARFHEASPVVAQIEGRADQARAGARLAVAPALPIVAVQGGYTRNNADAAVSLGDVLGTLSEALPVPVELDTASLPADLIIQPLEQWTASATAQVPLFAPSAWADATAARRAASAAAAGADAGLQAAEAGFVKAAFLARAAEDVAAARDHAVEVAQAHRDATARRGEVGLRTSLELLAAEAELVRRQGDALQGHADLDKARRALGALLDLDGPVRVAVPELAPAPDVAAAELPSVLAATAQVDAARAAEASAWWRHAPTLSAQAAVFTSDVAYPTGLTEGWRVGLAATWVLYDGGARYGLLARARAQGAIADGVLRQAVRDADRVQADAVAAVAVAEERLRLAEVGLATADEAEAAAERLFAAGVVSSLDAVDAQQRRLDAAMARAGAAASLAAAQADLGVARGLGWAER